MTTPGENHLEFIYLRDRVEGLEKKARSFENRMGRLRGRVTDLELLAFQE